MQSPSDPTQGQKARKPKGPASRDDRLKAALKANMARRKAQARARDGATGEREGGQAETRDSEEDRG